MKSTEKATTQMWIKAQLLLRWPRNVSLTHSFFNLW